jgi:hypothetical protein
MYRCTSTELPGVAGNVKVIAGLSVLDHRSVSNREIGVEEGTLLFKVTPPTA